MTTAATTAPGRVLGLFGGRRSRKSRRGECVDGKDSETMAACRKGRSRRHRGGKSRRSRASRRHGRK